MEPRQIRWVCEGASDALESGQHQKFNRIDAAFRAGDLAALGAAVDDPASVPNGPMPRAIGQLRTRINECETPREMAERAGLCDIARLLAAHEGAG